MRRTASIASLVVSAAGLALLALVAGRPARPAAQAPIVLRLQPASPASVARRDAFATFAERVERLSGGRLRIETTVRATDRTGVEMEALTAAAVAALSLYDTAKAFDRAARIDRLRLLTKTGGKSGDYVADA